MVSPWSGNQQNAWFGKEEESTLFQPHVSPPSKSHSSFTGDGGRQRHRERDKKRQMAEKIKTVRERHKELDSTETWKKQQQHDTVMSVWKSRNSGGRKGVVAHHSLFHLNRQNNHVWSHTLCSAEHTPHVPHRQTGRQDSCGAGLWAPQWVLWALWDSLKGAHLGRRKAANNSVRKRKRLRMTLIRH